MISVAFLYFGAPVDREYYFPFRSVVYGTNSD